MTTGPYALAAPLTTPRARTLGSLADYVELTKPRISVMVLITVAIGGFAAGGDWLALTHAVVGIGLAASGSAVLNQWLERESDARMTRTRGRPLPSGRVPAAAAIVYGLALVVLGVGWLIVVGATVAAAWTAGCMALYVLVYTPMKRWTAWNTLVGAVPGALPPVLGWLVADVKLTVAAWTLFAILFFWQFPHFMAIAWLLRDDYPRGGLRMATAGPNGGRNAAIIAVVGMLGLLVSVLSMWLMGTASVWCALLAAFASAPYAAATARFARRPADPSARSLLLASLANVPMVFGLLMLDLSLRGVFHQ